MMSGNTQAGNIAADLAALATPIDQLKPLPGNARRGDVDAVARSYAQFGQRKPLVARRDGTVTAGNHQLEAAKQLGWTHLAVVWTDDDDATAKAFALADNRTHDLGTYDDDALAALLADVAGTADVDLIAATGYSDDDIARLLAATGEHDPAPQPPPPYSAEQIIDAAFEHYRRVGFPYPSMTRHAQMQQLDALAALDDDLLRTSNIAYHVADGYHPDRYSTVVDGRITVLGNFERDDRLRVVLAMLLDEGKPITDASLLQVLAYARGAQLAAQFRPAFALWYLRRYCPVGGAVLDTSAGWGGRLLGFAASTAREYVGIDPSTVAHAGNTRMIDELGITGAQLINKPAEDVTVGRRNTDVVSKHFDVAITSPPYFAKERYADEPTQSFLRYPTADQWRAGFLQPMLALQHAALKPGAVNIVNIADVKMSSGADKFVPLADWTVTDATAAGFVHVASERFDMPRVPGGGETPTASEPVLIFRKPEAA